MNTLIIFELFDETAHLFVVPNNELSPEMLENLGKAQSKYINTDLSDEEFFAVNYVYGNLYEGSTYDEEDGDNGRPNPATYAEYKQDSYELHNLNVSDIYQMGFMP